MSLFLSQPTCKSSANPMELTISRIQPPLPTSTAISLLLSILNTAARMTQLMSPPVQNLWWLPVSARGCQLLSLPLNSKSVLPYLILRCWGWTPENLCSLSAGPCRAQPVGGAREREYLWRRRDRNIHLLPPAFSTLVTEFLTGACALTWNRTGNLLVHGVDAQPLSYTSQANISLY